MLIEERVEREEEEHSNRLSESEVEDISGYREEEPLVEQQYLMDWQPEEKEVHQNPLVRGGFMAFVIAIPLSLLFMMWQLFYGTKEHSPQVKIGGEKKEKEEKLSDEELGQLKAELALKDQQANLEEEQPEPKPELAIKEEKPPQAVKVVKQPTPPRPKSSAPVRVSRQAPTPMRVTRKPTPPPIKVTRQPTPPPPKPASTTSPVDPIKQWNTLANMGQSTVLIAANSMREVSTQDQNASSAEIDEKLAVKGNSKSTSKRSDRDIPSVTLNNAKPVSFEGEEIADGRMGILTRQSQQQPDSASVAEQVQIGTAVRGKLTMPLIWSPENSPTQNRFIIQLTEDLTSTTGEVVFTSGTLIVAGASQVSSRNGLVVADAVAVISTDDSGRIEKQELPSGAIAILGEDSKPLIAEGAYDPGGDVAKQDLLIGAISALGKIGEVINEPDSETSTSVSSSFSTITTTSSNSNKDLLAAAMDGFFSPLADRMGDRSEDAVNEMLNRPNIAVIETGTEVTLVVNSFFATRP
jgi:hypothetical protein